MNDEQRALLEKQRKKQSIKTMYFNRYLLVRYVTALFFLPIYIGLFRWC
ncbi:hypothetical protein AAHH67_26835 [Niallia circulans]